MLNRNVSRIYFGRCTNWTLWNTCQPFRTSASGNQTLSLPLAFSSPPPPFTWHETHAACSTTHTGWRRQRGKKRKTTNSRLCKKQQLVDNMCSLDLRRLHRQSKVSCHKTINLLLYCRQNATFLAKASRVPTPRASWIVNPSLRTVKEIISQCYERAISHVSWHTFSDVTEHSRRRAPPRTRCTAPPWQAHPSAQHVQVPIKCRCRSIKWRRRGVTP